MRPLLSSFILLRFNKPPETIVLSFRDAQTLNAESDDSVVDYLSITCIPSMPNEASDDISVVYGDRVKPREHLKESILLCNTEHLTIIKKTISIGPVYWRNQAREQMMQSLGVCYDSGFGKADGQA